MNDPDAPEIPLEDALKRLRNLPDFHVLIAKVHMEREVYIKAMETVTTDLMAMKNCGSIVGVDLILDMIEG